MRKIQKLGFSIFLFAGWIPAFGGQGVSNLGRSGVLPAARYVGLAAACRAFAGANGVVLVSGSLALKADVTLPANCGLWFTQGGYITGAHTLVVNGSIGTAGQYRIFAPSTTVIFGGQYHGRAKAAWWGVKADGGTDDTAALNAACRAVFSDPAFPVPLLLPTGKMEISGRGVRCGANVQTNGWVLHGSGGLSSRFEYSGSGVALSFLNIQWSHLYDFSVIASRGGSKTTGIFLTGNRPHEGGGSQNHFENIYISGFAVGLRIGDGLHQMGQNKFDEISLNEPLGVGVWLDGANVDGEVFDQLLDSSHIAIQCTGCQGVTVNGSDSSMHGNNNIYLFVDGDYNVDGPFSLRDMRIEKAAILAWVGKRNGQPVAGKQMNLKIDNVYYASTPAQPRLSAPGALTLVPSAGTGSLAPARYFIQCTALNGVMGETLPSPQASAELSAAGEMTVNIPAVPGAGYYRCYLSKYASMSPSYWLYSWSNKLIFKQDIGQYLVGAPPAAATTGARSLLVHYGETGTLNVENSDFSNGGPGEFFQFPVVSNTTVTFNLMGAKVTNTAPDTLCAPLASCVSGLVEVDALAGASGTAGGVIYQSTGNQIYQGNVLKAPYYARNRLVRFTVEDAKAGKQSVLWDCGTKAATGCNPH